MTTQEVKLSNSEDNISKASRFHRHYERWKNDPEYRIRWSKLAKEGWAKRRQLMREMKSESGRRRLARQMIENGLKNEAISEKLGFTVKSVAFIRRAMPQDFRAKMSEAMRKSRQVKAPTPVTPCHQPGSLDVLAVQGVIKALRSAGLPADKILSVVEAIQ